VRTNDALSADAQDFYLWFNRHLVSAPGQKHARSETQQRLRNYLEKYHNGKPRLPERAEVQAFYENFRSDNASIANDYFQREQLFTEIFDKYPVQCSPPVSNWFIARVMFGFSIYCLGQVFRTGAPSRAN
jgi:hypothetical protein